MGLFSSFCRKSGHWPRPRDDESSLRGAPRMQCLPKDPVANPNSRSARCTATRSKIIKRKSETHILNSPSIQLSTKPKHTRRKPKQAQDSPGRDEVSRCRSFSSGGCAGWSRRAAKRSGCAAECRTHFSHFRVFAYLVSIRQSSPYCTLCCLLA